MQCELRKEIISTIAVGLGVLSIQGPLPPDDVHIMRQFLDRVIGQFVSDTGKEPTHIVCNPEVFDLLMELFADAALRILYYKGVLIQPDSTVKRDELVCYDISYVYIW